MATYHYITGDILDGFDEVAQSIQRYIMPTSFGERVQLEEFGSYIPKILQKPLSADLVSVAIWSVTLAVELWEPRFKIKRVLANSTVDDWRAGKLNFTLIGDYRPRAHLGDFTVAREASINL